MPISKLTLTASLNNSKFILDLNVINKGWVAQVIEGTFGSSASYSFTDATITSSENSPIDINVRLTPTVSIPELSSNEILSLLSFMVPGSKVELEYDNIPSPTVVYTRTNSNSPYEPSVRELNVSRWTQNCVVREIKYNYSESPATIEFTISTEKPYLEGSELTLYHLADGRAPYQTHSAIFNKLETYNFLWDLVTLVAVYPAVSVGNYKTISYANFPYVIVAYSNNSSSPLEVHLDTNSSGAKAFSFGQGANPQSSYAYITSNPAVATIGSYSTLFYENYTKSGALSGSYGSYYKLLRLKPVRGGL